MPPLQGEPKVENGCPKGQSSQNINFFAKSHIFAQKAHFAIFCSKTAIWAPKAQTPYKRNGFLALFGAIWPRKLKMSKFQHFNGFGSLLRHFAFFGTQKSGNCEKLSSGTKKTLTNPFVLLAFWASGTTCGVWAPFSSLFGFGRQNAPFNGISSF